MPDRSLSTTGKIAIGLAIIAGLLTLGRALYNYNQNGTVDVGKIATGYRRSFVDVCAGKEYVDSKVNSHLTSATNLLP